MNDKKQLRNQEKKKGYGPWNFDTILNFVLVPILTMKKL